MIIQIYFNFPSCRHDLSAFVLKTKKKNIFIFMQHYFPFNNIKFEKSNNLARDIYLTACN